MKIEIKRRYSGIVLFTHEQEDNTVKLTVESAGKAGASLAGANLEGASLAYAYLEGASLAGANLARANLEGASLAGANLARANLEGASLAYANLTGANLAYAYLTGAYLEGEEKLVGRRPIFQIGPIGLRGAYLISYITDKGLRIRAGCFFGSVSKFKAMLKETHGDNEHAQEYKAALTLINKHAKIWSK